MARTTPKRRKERNSGDEERDYIFTSRIEGITAKEADQFAERTREMKRKIAPKSQGTIVTGTRDDLLDHPTPKRMIPEKTDQ